MAALPLIGHALNKAEMEYHGKFGHTLGRILHIALMSRLEILLHSLFYRDPKCGTYSSWFPRYQMLY